MKADLHIHSSYSYDSLSKPRDIVETAFKKGIDCLAICDHGQIKGAMEAIRFAKSFPLLIIPGIEIKSREGDVLGLNVRKIIPNGLSAKETIKRIKKEGGFAIIPHPFSFNCSFRGKWEQIMKSLDAIEVLNASVFGGNKKALAFAIEHNLAMTAGSDAHQLSLVGKAYLEIPSKNLSIEEVFKQIKNKNVRIKGEEAGFFEKAFDHLGRNIIRATYYVSRKKGKI